MSSSADFILANTVLVAPPLVPEIRLHLATEVTPLWPATEAALERAQLPPPYWAFAWPGGQAIARHILDHPALVRGKTVLDFGAGSGLVAIAAMMAGARAVTAAELDPFAAAAIALNAAANGVAIEIATEDMIGSAPCWETVLVGDMCYERPLAERLTSWMGICADGGALVLLGDPGRAYLPRTRMVELARHDVPTPLDLEDREMRETVVYCYAAERSSD
jgi:predicted nicotinamide N-methyase